MPTKGDFQKQCAVCEGSAAGDIGAKFLAGQSLIQRANGAVASNGDTVENRNMDKQFQTTTPETREYITNKRINYLVENFRRKIKQDKGKGSAPIYTIFNSDASKIDNFLNQLELEINSLVH